MKAHPSLSRLYVISKGPQAIVLMIASEFGRAAKRCEHRDNVLNCYLRARELMEILETLPLPLEIGESLQPWFRKASEKELLREERLQPSWVQTFCTQAASEFNLAASLIG